MNVGCTDTLACNYDPNAYYNDNSCTYIVEGNCDCDGNQLDALEYVVATVLLTLTQTEYVMTRTTVLERMTSVVYVMVLELSTSVDVQIFQRETVTVMETSLTH